MTYMTGPRWKGNRALAGRAVFLLLGLATLASIALLGCGRASKPASQNSNADSVKGILHLESFVVNLADPEDNHFLRVGIDLGLAESLRAREGKGGEGQLPIAPARDCILSVLSTWHSDALLAPEGKQKLKNELLHALQERVPELEVKEVYFTDFLVQR